MRQVLFNRFLEPDIDCKRLSPAPDIPLSTAAEMRLPLTWIALLHRRLHASLAATTGVVAAADVVKYLLAVADVVQSASALLRHSPEYAGVMLALHDDGSAWERGDYVPALAWLFWHQMVSRLTT